MRYRHGELDFLQRIEGDTLVPIFTSAKSLEIRRIGDSTWAHAYEPEAARHRFVELETGTEAILDEPDAGDTLLAWTATEAPDLGHGVTVRALYRNAERTVFMFSSRIR